MHPTIVATICLLQMSLLHGQCHAMEGDTPMMSGWQQRRPRSERRPVQLEDWSNREEVAVPLTEEEGRSYAGEASSSQRGMRCHADKRGYIRTNYNRELGTARKILNDAKLSESRWQELKAAGGSNIQDIRNIARERKRLHQLKYTIRSALEANPRDKKALAVMKKEGLKMNDVATKKNPAYRNNQMDPSLRGLIMSYITQLRNDIADFNKHRRLKGADRFEDWEERRLEDYDVPIPKSSAEEQANMEAIDMMNYTKQTQIIFRKGPSDARLQERADVINDWMSRNLSIVNFKSVNFPNLPTFTPQDQGEDDLPNSFQALSFDPSDHEGTRKYICDMFGDDDDVVEAEEYEQTDGGGEEEEEIDIDEEYQW